MKTFFISILILLASLMLTSCIERIEVPNAREAGVVNIYGLITPTNAYHTVNISLTSGNNRLSEVVSGAQVKLLDDLGNEGKYEEWEAGEYRLYPFLIERVPGRTYHIEVTMPNGQLYRSYPATMPTQVGSDSAYWEVSPYRNIEVFTDSRVPNNDQPVYLRWIVEQNFIFEPTDFPDPFNRIPPPCYVWEYGNRQRITLHNSTELKTDLIPRQKLVSTPIDYRFKQRHYFFVEQLSITKEAHEYWSNVNVTANNTGSIFDTPPAKISGNLYNPNDPEEQVLGYFEVAKTDTNSFFVTVSEFDFTIERYCEYYPSVPWYNLYSTDCLDCLTIPFSSYTKPDFWP